MNNYSREELRPLLEESARIRKESEMRVKNAAGQIVEISSQLHLTVAEFDRAIREASARVQNYVRICHP